MIVREYLNEIKINKETSGLSSIGIGKEGVLKGWSSAKKEIPNIIYRCKQMSEVFAGPRYNDLRKIIERQGNFSFEDMIWIDVKQESFNFTVERMLRDWGDLWNFSTIFIVGGAEWAYRHTVCKFDENSKVGILKVKNHDTIENINGYFIQNK